MFPVPGRAGGGAAVAGSGAAPSDPEVGPDELCRALVGDLSVDGASVSVRADVDHSQPVCATDNLAEALDELHLTLNEGPRVDAFRERGPFAVPDLTAGTAARRWPVFARESGCAGSRRAVRLSLSRSARWPSGTVIGVSAYAGMLTAAAATSAQATAAAMARSVLGELHQAESRAVRRDEVAIATGMVAVQAASSVSHALALLRAAAFAEHVSIREIAEAVIRRTRRSD